MTKTQYNKWVDDTYLMVDSCKNLGTINVILNHDKTFVMVIDLVTMRTSNQEIKDDNVREATAIAFTKLKREKIPEITDSPDYKRVPFGSDYYTIIIKDGREFTDNYTEMSDEYDTDFFETNNYFHTKERAEEVLNKIKMLLRLERLHDMLCPKYKPLSNSLRYCVIYNSAEKEWIVCDTISLERRPQVYFPTKEIAQQAADILNKENN